jgi:hypothetical protein
VLHAFVPMPGARFAMEKYGSHLIRLLSFISLMLFIYSFLIGVAAGESGYDVFHDNYVMHDYTILVIFGLIFLLPFFDVINIVSLRNLDIIMLLGWGPSYLMFSFDMEIAIFLFYPPLIYFVLRMWYEVRKNIKADSSKGRLLKPPLRTNRIEEAVHDSIEKVMIRLDAFILKIASIARGEKKGKKRPRKSKTRLNTGIFFIKVLIIILLVYRIHMALSYSVIDIGVESADGANLLLEEKSPYHHDFVYTHEGVTSSIPHTYGPFTYIFYTPFVAMFPFDTPTEDIMSAKIAAICTDIIIVMGLFLLGSSIKNSKFGYILVFAWLAHPFTVISLKHSANDMLPFALLVWGLLLISKEEKLRKVSPKEEVDDSKAGSLFKGSSIQNSVLLALSAMAKFFYLPLFFIFVSLYRGKQKALFIILFVVSVLLTVSIIFLEPEGIEHFIDSTIGYQTGRGEYGEAGVGATSIWTIYSMLEPLRYALLALFALYCILMYFYPKDKGFYMLCALSATVILGVQILNNRYSTFYIPWVLGFLLLVIFKDFAGKDS